MSTVPASEILSPPVSAARPISRLAIAAILAAVSLWGLQFVMIRLAITTTLTATDLAFLRYLFAMPTMIPILLMYGGRGDGLGWGQLLLLSLGGGAPLLLISNIGLGMAPASHAACLQPGTVVVVSTLFLLGFSGMRRNWLVPVGVAIVVAGLAGVALGGAGGVGTGPNTPLGDALFILCGVLWAAYTIMLAKWRASPALTTAWVAVISLAMMLPLMIVMPSKLATAPWSDILIHGLFQGVANYTIAFLLWAYAARELGPVKMGFFAPLIPVTGVISGIPLLGEWPLGAQWLGIAGVAVGLGCIAFAQRQPQAAAPVPASS